MKKYFSEFTFTLLFIIGIMVSIKRVPKHLLPIFVGISLAVSVFLTVAFDSPAHLNPAISFYFFIINKISSYELLGFVISQMMAGLVASKIYLGLK